MKLGGCGLHLVPKKLEVISGSSEVKSHKFPKFVGFHRNLVDVD